ncbi:TPA: extracellular solute-binding protein, partial [Candidatus Bathyarchaeota archaeon]|nr:extracellular solute-binding protein [Candidatus Bathyarchaeota archaeon]
DIIYTYMGREWLTDLTAFAEEHPELVDPECDPKDFTAFGLAFTDAKGHFHAYPYEAFLKTQWYRSDLFADPDIKAKFKEKYGYELKPAETWEQFIDIARFFYDWGKDRTPRMYGTGFQMIGITLPYLFVEGFFPPHGVYTWGINLKKMRASVEKGGTLNSPKAVKAFEDFFKLLEVAPPETPTFSWGGNCDAMAAERTPMGACEYSEAMGAVATDPTVSKVVGKVRATLPPLEPGVLDEVMARPRDKPWEAYVNYYDGGAFGIPWCSKRKEAGFLFIQFMTNKAGARVTTEKAFAPTRVSVLDEFVGGKIDKETGYFTLVKEKDWMYGPAPPFREHKLLIEKYYDKWIHRIVAKEVGIKEGLDALAHEVDEALE